MGWQRSQCSRATGPFGSRWTDANPANVTGDRLPDLGGPENGACHGSISLLEGIASGAAEVDAYELREAEFRLQRAKAGLKQFEYALASGEVVLLTAEGCKAVGRSLRLELA